EVGVWHAQAQGRLASLSPKGALLVIRQLALEVVVALLRVAALRDVAGLDLLTGGEGLVQQAGGLQLLDDTLIDVTALRLAVRLVRSADVDALVPVDLQPAECLEQLEVALLAV